MIDDAEMLQRFAESNDEAAFRELVRRHVDLVHSAALRQVNGDEQLARDVTQLVFTDLARKATRLRGHRILAGWLFTSTRFAASKLVRGEQRRRSREQEAQLMEELTSNPDAALDWEKVRPVLDRVLAELGEDERDAILLRFFEGRDFSTIGLRFRLTENAARMRSERALEKLRVLLARRGITSTSAALAAALAGQAVGAAPAGLAASIAQLALQAGAAGPIAGLFTLMTLTKTQVAVGGVLAATAAIALLVQAHNTASLRRELKSLQDNSAEVATLTSENEQLRQTAAEAAGLQQDDAEFARLREAAERLGARMAAAAPAGASRPRQLGAYDISKLDRAPSPTSQTRPAYPPALRTEGVSGEVVVDFIIDPFGKVQNAHAISSTREEFASAAVEAVSHWTFSAGIKDGQNVATHLQVPIVFSMSHESKKDQLPGKAEPPPGY